MSSWYSYNLLFTLSHFCDFFQHVKLVELVRRSPHPALLRIGQTVRKGQTPLSLRCGSLWQLLIAGSSFKQFNFDPKLWTTRWILLHSPPTTCTFRRKWAFHVQCRVSFWLCQGLMWGDLEDLEQWSTIDSDFQIIFIAIRNLQWNSKNWGWNPLDPEHQK